MSGLPGEQHLIVVQPRALLRASDADRERIANRLRHAASEGRLWPDELEDRLGAALSARTYGELDRVVSDLPAETENHHERPDFLDRISTRTAIALAALVIALLLIAGALGAGFHRVSESYQFPAPQVGQQVH
jgi:hypothetical protein